MAVASRASAGPGGLGERLNLRTLIDAFEEHDLLTYASAIAFQVLSALVPLALFALALLGFLHLDAVWTSLAAQLRPDIGPAGFTVIDDAVQKVLHTRQFFWLTGGAALAIWELSGAMRAVMGALAGIYGEEESRPLRERLRVSIGLAVAVTACTLLAIASVRLGALLLPDAPPGVRFALALARWAVAVALLILAVGLLIRHAPASSRPLPWVSFGSGLVVVGWIGMSLAFGFYVSSIASYDSIFGSLASVFVLITYLYLSAIVFVGGVQIDALVRPREEGDGA